MYHRIPVTVTIGSFVLQANELGHIQIIKVSYPHNFSTMSKHDHVMVHLTTVLPMKPRSTLTDKCFDMALKIVDF